jgi:hypothetical protein
MSHALFPFVVMARLFPGRTPIATLTDEVHFALLKVTTDGTSNTLFREDLEKAHIDPTKAYLDARDRLKRLVRGRMIRVRSVLGPGHVPCLAFEHTLLGASCAVLPDLYGIAQRQLRTDAMLLAMPRRDLLIVAPSFGGVFQDELATLFSAHGRIFALDPSGPGRIGGGLRPSGTEVSASVSNDTMIPISVQSFADAEDTQPAARRELRPYRQVVIKKRCA